jgi:hypothetical protein
MLTLCGALSPAFTRAKPNALPMLVNSFKSYGEQLAESLAGEVDKCWQWFTPW